MALTILLTCALFVFGRAGTPPPPTTMLPVTHSTIRPTVEGGYDPDCKDVLSDCRSYGPDACEGDYRQWAIANCEATCGFCTPPPTAPPPCVDVLTNCDSYDQSVCGQTEYRGWAEANCRKYCRFCTASQLAEIDSHTTLPTPIPPEQCYDKEDCRMYGPDVCDESKYGGWIKDNCPLYCHLCVGVATAAPPCVDKSSDCALYQSDLCTNSAFSFFVDENCRRFCGRCGISTPPHPCVDKQPDCASYGIEVCSNVNYTIWVEDHCPKFCGVCGGSTANVTFLTPPAPTSPPMAMSMDDEEE